MIDTLSVTFPADTYRERIKELSDHGMNERITLFEIIDQLLHVTSLRRGEILFLFEYRESEKCSYISQLSLLIYY